LCLRTLALLNLSYTQKFPSHFFFQISDHSIITPGTFPLLISIAEYSFILPIALLELGFSFGSLSLYELCLYGFCVCACVLATSAMDYSFMYPWAKKRSSKEVSYYTIHLRLRDLRENNCTMRKTHESHVKTVECREGELICCDDSSDSSGPFCFFYATYFKKVLLHLPLSIFEKEQFIDLNVAPAQLHPNS